MLVAQHFAVLVCSAVLSVFACDHSRSRIHSSCAWRWEMICLCIALFLASLAILLVCALCYALACLRLHLRFFIFNFASFCCFGVFPKSQGGFCFSRHRARRCSSSGPGLQQGGNRGGAFRCLCTRGLATQGHCNSYQFLWLGGRTLIILL